MTDQLDRLTTALADRYIVERELGSGGMATVCLAHDTKHNRKVAINGLRLEAHPHTRRQPPRVIGVDA